MQPAPFRPAFLHVPPSAVGNLGDEVADLARALDQEVGEPERVVLGALTPVRADGRCAGLAACVICGRRNIKSWAMEFCAIHDAWVLQVRRIMWSAHLFSTTMETFIHLKALIDNYDWLRKRVRKVRDANGEEGFDFLHGGRMDFVARQSGKTGRGKDVDRLYLDEWLFGTSAQLGAMLPTMAASPDPFVRFGSSPGIPTSEALRALRVAGRGGLDESLSYVEATCESIDEQGRTVVPECRDAECDHLPTRVGCISDDEALIAAANPAYGRRISAEFVANERRLLPPAEFRRERLGIWEDPPPVIETESDDTLAGWDRWERKDARTVGPVALAVDVGHDGKSAALVACGRDADGVLVVDVVRYWRSGFGGLAAALADLRSRHVVRAVGVAGGSPAAALDLFGVEQVKSGDQPGACSGLARDLAEGRLVHLGQPSLTISARAARRQMVGEVWRWSRRLSSSDISPLWAAVVARHVLLAAETARPYNPLANFMPNLT